MSQAEHELAHARLVVGDIAEVVGVPLDERQQRLLATIVIVARREARADQLAALRTELAQVKTLVVEMKGKLCPDQT